VTELPRTAAIIVAGGTGERLGRPEGKQLAPVLGRPVLAWTLGAFEAAAEIDLIVLVCYPTRLGEYRRVAVDPYTITTPVVFAPGGETRQASVASGLALVPPSVTTVLVHDGARPLVTPALISGALAALSAHPDADGLVVGHPAVDTLKVVVDGSIAETPDRSRFWAVQTPQIFSVGVLREAYAAAARDGFLGTDDAALVERLGKRVRAYQGPRDNIKVTVAEDLRFVEAALKFRAEEASE
jgi:2-C-methyl-D-erythritol 4-phosphate cytidylyltransferase